MANQKNFHSLLVVNWKKCEVTPTSRIGCSVGRDCYLQLVIDGRIIKDGRPSKLSHLALGREESSYSIVNPPGFQLAVVSSTNMWLPARTPWDKLTLFEWQTRCSLMPILSATSKFHSFKCYICITYLCGRAFAEALVPT